LKIKASGGIADLDTALRMLEAGAARLGTSRSVGILREMTERAASGVF
jgi:deoxyribose-phosphate aldolase